MMPNQFAGRCVDCGRRVEPGAGVLEGKDPATDRWRVVCDACAFPPAAGPTRPPPKTRARRRVPACLVVLGLTPPVDREAIRRRYRALALVNHPDRGGDPAAFIKIKAAYDQALAATAGGIR